MAGPWEAFQDANAGQMARADAAVVAPPRAAVPSTPRVWGDAEAEQAGLYEQQVAQGPWAAFRKEPTRITVNPPPRDRFGERFNAAPRISQGGAFTEGVRSGATANFGDELAGVSAAAQTPNQLKNPFDFPTEFARGLAQLGYEYLTGGDDAAKRYAGRRDEIRADQKAAQEQYPATNIAGQVTGAVALPVGGVLNAATLPVRMARGAAVGAGYGGLSGAGEGQTLEDRASRATTGALVGGVVGAAAPPVVEGAIQLGRAAINPVVTGVRGAINPEAEAARRVATAVERDLRADPQAVQRLTPQEFAASAQSGGPARIMDIGGETTRGLARSAANTSPEGRGLMNRAIDERFEGQGDRVTGWLRQTFNYPNAQAQQEALEKAASAVNRPAYRAAYSDGMKVMLWDDELKQLAQAPEIQAAIRIALPQLRNWAVKDGMAPPKGAFDIVDGKTILKKTESGNTILPSLQYWDYVKRALDGMKTPTSAAFAKALREKLDELVPSYKQARAGAAHFFGAENALEAGQNYVMQNFANAETRRALAGMSQQERQLFQDGFVSRLIEIVERTGDRRNVLNQIASSPAAREKMNIALGPQRAAELEAGLRVEGIMDLARGAVQGNSNTVRQLAEIGFAGGAGGVGGIGAYNMDPTQMTYAAIAGALLAGKRGIDTRVAQRVAQMLVSDDPRQLMRGIQLVARNGRMMDSLRFTDAKITQVAAQEIPKGAAVQIPAPGRAEDEQPNVPRIPR